jgi:hypothetical protein
MSLLNWLKSLRRSDAPTAADIRRQLHEARGNLAVCRQQRDLVALDAVTDEVAARRWLDLDDACTEVERQIALLASALPQAEQREADAARQAEEQRRERALSAYQQHTQEAQRLHDDLLDRLPDGDTLTALRDWRDRLATEAGDLRPFSRDVTVRRPLDPLDALVAAMQHRIDRVSRARWAHSAPITLGGGLSTDETAAAVTRIERTGA